jgi:hypothetical protein
MKKNITILVIILLSHLKNNKIIFLENKSIIFKNIYLNKNPKNYKKKHSTNSLIRNYIVKNGGKKIRKLSIKKPANHWVLRLLKSNLIKKLQQFTIVNKFDYNVLDLLFYGCRIII